MTGEKNFLIRSFQNKKGSPPDEPSPSSKLQKITGMESINLNNYVEKNYQKWLDYANFYADKNGLTGMGEEILQFVFDVVLVDMDRQRVLKLLNSKYGNYNELHTYILGMIKISAYSPRSDFRRKVINGSHIDYNVDFRKLKIPDEEFNPDIPDRSEEIFSQFQWVRNELETLEVSTLHKDVFRFKFFCGNPLSEWPGPEPKEKIYKIYNQVRDLLKERVETNQLQVS